MDHLFQTNESRVLFYLDENSRWMRTTRSLAEEIPSLKKMLTDKGAAMKDDYSINEKKYFQQQLENQQQEIKKLNEQMNEQEGRLREDAARHSLYDVNALCSQDILRDRIKEIEKRYIELKYDFMKFLSAIL